MLGRTFRVLMAASMCTCAVAVAQVTGQRSSPGAAPAEARPGAMTAPEAARTGGPTRYNGGNGAETASARMAAMKISAGDKVFLVCAASSNKAEIAMAQMALKKSDNASVKQIANNMISDHQMAQDQLMALAKQKGVDLDAKLAPSQETASEELAKLDGAEFDKAYLAINHGAHLEAIGQFTHASMHADDPQVKAWAGQILPKLQMHNQMVEQAMGSGTGGSMQTMPGMGR